MAKKKLKKQKKVIKKGSKKTAKKAIKKKVIKKKSAKKKVTKKAIKKKKVKSKKKTGSKKLTKKTKKKTKKTLVKKKKKSTKTAKKTKKAAKKVTKKKVTKKKKQLTSVSKKASVARPKPDIKDETEEAFKEELVILKDAEGNKLCCSKDCDQIATVVDSAGNNYCRLHYISLWESIQLRNSILTGNILKNFIYQVLDRYPEKFLDMMRKDLCTEKDFIVALQDLGVSDTSPFDDDLIGYESDDVSEEY